MLPRFLLILFAALLLGCDADTQVLMSSREKLNPGIAKPTYLTVNGLKVECWIGRSPAAEKDKPLAYVLYFVGQGDQVERYLSWEASTWAQPIEIWGMNYPGSGGSEGPPRIARVGPDALATYDAIRKAAGDKPIVVQGMSLGTSVALCVAASRPVNGVILINPPPLRQLIIGEYSWWNLGLISHFIAGQVPDDLDSIANASKAKAPAVILSAGADDTVPPRYQKMVINAYAGPKQIVEMPGRGHEDGLTPDAAAKLAAGKEWLLGIAREKVQRAIERK